MLNQSERMVTNAIVESLNALEELAKNPLDYVQNAEHVKSLLNYSHVIKETMADSTTFAKASKANRSAVIMSTGNQKLHKTDVNSMLLHMIAIYDEQDLYGRKQRNLTSLLQDMAWTTKQGWHTKDEELEGIADVIFGFSEVEKYSLIHDVLSKCTDEKFDSLLRQFTFKVPSSSRKELVEFCEQLRFLDEEQSSQLYQSFISKLNEKLVDHNLKCLKGVADFKAFLIDLLTKDDLIQDDYLKELMESEKQAENVLAEIRAELAQLKAKNK